MKLLPKTKDEWDSLMATAIKGGAFITDVLLTKGMSQFLVGKVYAVRLDKTLRELRSLPQELKEEIKDKVSKEYLSSPEFLVFISNALTEAVSLKNIEKLGYFRSAIISGIIKGDIEEGRKILFIDALSDLSIDSLILLASINDMSSGNREAHLSFLQIKHTSGYNDINYLVANLKSLEKYNLIELIKGQIRQENSYEHYAVIYGNFGKGFISFIMDYHQPTAVE